MSDEELDTFDEMYQRHCQTLARGPKEADDKDKAIYKQYKAGITSIKKLAKANDVSYNTVKASLLRCFLAENK